ncbi:MAG: hypothetical protein JSC188_001017 [Candidatus Tokpelaia sp. JSC188]|nr:MAG: hypothetical protein JSC188_001017 [Candidatus Tokpelaia sp. JSC188]
MTKKDDNMNNKKILLSSQALRAFSEAEERHLLRHKWKESVEIGGPRGKEPTRYGDWEIKGRSIDF